MRMSSEEQQGLFNNLSTAVASVLIIIGASTESAKLINFHRVLSVLADIGNGENGG